MEIVVDACVARSASGTEHPVSSSCRNFLAELTDKDSKCSLVMTSEIKEEWKRHASRFSRKLLVSLISRGKVKNLSVSNNKIRKLIENCKEINRIDPMRKDVHLIEAAIATDNTIFSTDDRARNHFEFLSCDSVEMQFIYWVNPVTSNAESISWIRDEPVLKDYFKLGGMIINRDVFCESASASEEGLDGD
ncbi:hypothetical protein PD280_21455 [Virgibacillus salarius]|uniref:hypothetical protein n=1 Tax=Virgibacillus salarius TaxID=447199 RepID=UPI00249039DF|nr:hypothetical protein [Virgibacillus salarius]WBX80134.1 hypothetical protein PD280_21455 [Virgibacillus salarius]